MLMLMANVVLWVLSVGRIILKLEHALPVTQVMDLLLKASAKPAYHKIQIVKWCREQPASNASQGFTSAQIKSVDKQVHYVELLM